MAPSDPLSYVPGSEHYHPTISTLGGHGGRLERDRERVPVSVFLPSQCHRTTVAIVNYIFFVFPLVRFGDEYVR